MDTSLLLLRIGIDWVSLEATGLCFELRSGFASWPTLVL